MQTPKQIKKKTQNAVRIAVRNLFNIMNNQEIRESRARITMNIQRHTRSIAKLTEEIKLLDKIQEEDDYWMGNTELQGHLDNIIEFIDRNEGNTVFPLNRELFVDRIPFESITF